MDSYVTGTAIRQLREAKHLTQAELAEKLAVSAKAISKWETAHGLPDISLLEPLAAALGVSVLELMQGEPVVNRNRSANLLRSKLYVCPLCGNVLHATGQAVVSCCGITLPPLDISEVDDADEHHQLTLERVEDELFVTIHHHQTRKIRTCFRLEKGSDFSFSSGTTTKVPVDGVKLRYLVIDRKPITRFGGCDYEVRCKSLFVQHGYRVRGTSAPGREKNFHWLHRGRGCAECDHGATDRTGLPYLQ